ncbi:Pentatricopeptide repeat-containing protein At1g10270 [Linum grandiflorum]
MSLYRLLLLHRSSSSSAISSFAPPLTRALHYFTSHPLTAGSLIPTPQLSIPSSRRTFAFSSAEEAAAERRRRKRRLRIEPPMHALQRDPHPPVRDPNAPRLPDSTSALVGPRLSLHNRVQSLIRAFDLDAASYLARTAVFSRIRPTVFTCNAIIAAMYRAKSLIQWRDNNIVESQRLVGDIHNHLNGKTSRQDVKATNNSLIQWVDNNINNNKVKVHHSHPNGNSTASVPQLKNAVE